MEHKNTINILVTGVGGPAGINLVGGGRPPTDVTVIGCDIDPTASGQLFVDTFLISPYVRDAVDYTEWMKAAVATHKIDIVVPTVHEELALLATFAHELPAFVPLSPKETLALGADKLPAYQWAQEHLSAYAPRFVLPRDWTPDWSSDDTLFIKPRVGRGARGCRTITPAELVGLVEKGQQLDEYIVMEHLPGQEWTIDIYVAKNGEVVYSIPRERLGLAGGISIKGRTTREKLVLEATKLLLSQLDIRGPVCVQFKADAAGTPRFVEINPRLSGGLMISVAGGIDPVAALLADYKGETPQVQDWQEVTVVGYLAYEPLNP